MENSFKSLVQYGTSFVFLKYSIVGIGFVRSIFIASVLTVNDMGLLAFYFLIIEYSTLILPIGSANSVNKQISNLKNDKKLLRYNDNESELIYASSLFIILLSLIAFVFILFFIDSYLINLLPKERIQSKPLFLAIVVLGIYRSFAVMHNRLWQRYKRLFISEISYALVYLISVLLLAGAAEDHKIILQVWAFSLAVSILLSGFFPSFLKLRKLNFKSIKITSNIGFFLMCYMTMEQLFWGIDRFFIASVLDPEQLAVFHISHTFGRGVMMFYAAITFLFYPLLLTMYSKKIDDSQRFSSTVLRMSRFSESVMILALIPSIIVIPYVMRYFLPQYPDITTLLHLILIGLILKGLAFFPSSYFIAVSWQKNLTLISFIYIILTGTIYLILGNIFSLHAFGYTSIAVFIFFAFLFSLTYILLIKIKYSSALIMAIKIYYKIFITMLISIILLSIPNIFLFIQNIYLLLFFVICFYLNNFVQVFSETVLPILSNDKSKILKSILQD